MSVGLRYPDKITIFNVSPGLYGQEVIEDEAVVAAIFVQNTGWSHSGNQDAITSSATAFVDPTDEFVRNNVNRLEGLPVVAQFAGIGESDAWYRITDVSVSRDSLLENRIDNIQISLQKSTSIRGIS